MDMARKLSAEELLISGESSRSKGVTRLLFKGEIILVVYIYISKDFIQVLPEGLPDMYMRITDRICGKSGADQQLAKCIITWLTYAQRPLTELELGELQSIRNSTPDYCEDLSRVVVMVCASPTERVMLLNSRYSEHVPCYRFIHLSAKEYLSIGCPCTDCKKRMRTLSIECGSKSLYIYIRKV